jgi:hypothetical protein
MIQNRLDDMKLVNFINSVEKEKCLTFIDLKFVSRIHVVRFQKKVS